MRIQGIDISVSRTRTVVIGSGCAGLNAADWLATLGETSVLLMTDGMNRGTSRNAGSDKQTYYKLSLAGDQPDSVLDMARDLAGEGVHGDIALAEAAGSVAAFLRLAQLGVPFPGSRQPAAGNLCRTAHLQNDDGMPGTPSAGKERLHHGYNHGLLASRG